MKLTILGDYLKQFARASTRSWHRYYIDGFAGCGQGIDPRTGQTYDGSARLCFEVEPPFTRCFLIENDPKRAAMLQEIARERNNARVVQGDVNEQIENVLGVIEPQAATFAFLDPEGTELHWSTIERVAAHKRGHPYKVELLILFPLQMCVLRLLNFKTGVVPKVHEEKLERMLGAESPWRDISMLVQVCEVPLDGAVVTLFEADVRASLPHLVRDAVLALKALDVHAHSPICPIHIVLLA